MRTLAAAFVAGLAFLAAGCGGGEDVPALPKGKFMATSQSFTPKVALFAEPIVARIDVLLDTQRYDPDRIDIAADFAPYEKEGDPVRTRRDQGRYTHLRFEYTVRCLVYACLPEVAGGPPEVQPGGLPAPVGSQAGGFGERKTVDLKPANVTYDHPEKGKQRVRRISWPVVQAVSRLNFGDTNVTGIGFPFEANVTPLPEASYRVSPGLLGVGLIAAGLLLLALPALLVVRAFRKEPEVVEEPEPELSPLERALRLVEWSRDKGPEERREALEALAFELDEPDPELAWESRRIAWTPPEPDRAAMGRLVEAVRAPAEAEEAAGAEGAEVAEEPEEPEDDAASA
jgi:hypothetical protein